MSVFGRRPRGVPIGAPSAAVELVRGSAGPLMPSPDGSPRSITDMLSDLPGVSELGLICENARRVQAICDALGVQGGTGSDAPGLVFDLELADGAFLLPPE